MPVRKNIKAQPKTTLLELPSGSDLPLRLNKISEQTGVSSFNLLQKWILQEEFLIGVIQRSKASAPKRAEARPGVSKSAKGPGTEDRKKLVKRAKQLLKEGKTLKEIAGTFNEEKIPPVSGAGKWYSNSINNLLNSKK